MILGYVHSNIKRLPTEENSRKNLNGVSETCSGLEYLLWQKTIYSFNVIIYNWGNFIPQFIIWVI